MGNATTGWSVHDFLFNLNKNYVSILYRFRDKAGFLSKVADFDPPYLHSAKPVEFRGDLWQSEN